MTPIALAAAQRAGRIVLDHYGRSITVSKKADGTAVTQADLDASSSIRESLSVTGLPVLCEEAVVDYSIRKNWSRFWIVDPLDGTKEFIERTGEFTVNIALIDGSRPVLGVIHAPVLDLMAWAEEGRGAFLKCGEETTQLKVSPTSRVGVRSRRHSTDWILRLFSENGVEKEQEVGSALKFLHIARGMAGLYARAGGSHEWDTAAGQIILLEAGGWLCEADSKRPLRYNKEDLQNAPFVSGSLSWDRERMRWPEGL